MAIVNTYAAESWDAVYQAFNQINFTSYDFDTVKESLLQYLQIYHAESFNDFIESDELIALLEIFAYCAELLAYRSDQNAHENFMTTAQRKQSILRLASLISYSASRNIPARGLVKINTIRTAEQVYDSLGNNLQNTTITWNDPNNSNWKEQFFLVMNLVLTQNFGQPSKSFQVADVLLQLYTLNNDLSAFTNGVYPFTASSTTAQVNMEVVPADVDSNGPLERAPDLNAQFSILYSSDGLGDGSDYTGFLMFVKQGSLLQTNYSILQPTANRRIVLDAQNVNDIDVWVYEVDSQNSITAVWQAVDSLQDQSLSFNNLGTRNLYQIQSLENDQIALLFGDGNFSNAPAGDFQVWTRVSVNQNISIPANQISGQQMGFTYTTAANVSYQFNLTFSLTSALQNNSASETTEHVRQAAPSTYYSQNRIVNAQDANTYMLRDSTILKLNTINRTFAGQPKYIEWNDASGAYQNIKLFGDDLTMTLQPSVDMLVTTDSSRTLIDTDVTPLLQTNALLNVLTHVLASTTNASGIITYPRTEFIEDNRTIYYDINGNPVVPYGYQLDNNPVQAGDGSLKEKTMIQAALDQHWYGEPLSFATINDTLCGVVPDPILNPETDDNLYVPDLPRTIDGVNIYPPGDVGSGLQPVQSQPYFGLAFNPFLQCFGNGTIALYDPTGLTTTNYGTGAVTPAPAQGIAVYNYKIETLTLEMTSDGSTFTIISNIRGQLPSYSLTLGGKWSTQANLQIAALPVDFIITDGDVLFEEGDAFVIDISYQSSAWTAAVRLFGEHSVPSLNLNGWWELIPSDVITGPTTPASGNQIGADLFADGPLDGPNAVQQQTFDPNVNAYSWVFLISSTKDTSGNVLSWNVFNRDMQIIVQSPTTNFWYDTTSQIIDPETLKPLYDKIRILRSNLDAYGRPLQTADVYDVVGLVYDSNGVIIPNQLKVLPTDTETFTQSGTGFPGNLLQFENFSQDSYQFTLVNVADPSNPVVVEVLTCGTYTYVSGYDVAPYDIGGYDSGALEIDGITYEGLPVAFTFVPGDYVSNIPEGTDYQVFRTRVVPAPAILDQLTNEYGCNIVTGLDFMWQHFTPDSNLIDPSVSNIHDAYILTQGYYTSVQSYVNGLSTVNPQPPTPLDLVTSYGYLLNNKMLSDTIVLHPGKIKLLFGSLADQTLRAKFLVVMAPTATFSSQRIQQEVVNTINTYFQIQNWNFGDTFYATELIGLIHQALPTQISSVVLVPTYSVNSFGSLFTIESGFDEVLQSCAQITDVEIVTSLTPTALRQNS